MAEVFSHPRLFESLQTVGLRFAVRTEDAARQILACLSQQGVDDQVGGPMQMTLNGEKESWVFDFPLGSVCYASDPAAETHDMVPFCSPHHADPSQFFSVAVPLAEILYIENYRGKPRIYSAD